MTNPHGFNISVAKGSPVDGRPLRRFQIIIKVNENPPRYKRIIFRDR